MAYTSLVTRSSSYLLIIAVLACGSGDADRLTTTLIDVHDAQADFASRAEPLRVNAPPRPPGDTTDSAGTLTIRSIHPEPQRCSPDAQCIVEVEVVWRPTDASAGNRLHILVGFGNEFWGQALPVRASPDRWRADGVYVGQPGDTAGTAFRVCAVVSAQAIGRGQKLLGLPTGPSACIRVARGTSTSPRQ